jgi:hypothetical protein
VAPFRALFVVLLSLVPTASLLWPTDAEACGCFTPPDPTVPVLQAGERILFAVKDGQVTSHVQIQYSGNAKDFGWLLPLPSVPTLELGVDELFTQLYATTQPQYRMSTQFDSNCRQGFSGGTGGGSGAGGAGGGTSFGGAQDAGAAWSPLVVQDSIGPYDYAVLKADSKDAMLQWLADNRYFVPVGTSDGVAPYIHAGGFFLALKLKSDASTGDLQPIVLKYASDVGMIPITLTSTGAVENMGVQVWMLGTGRAIPRNYHHTVINDAAIDWVRSGANYNDVIIRAVGEAPEKHTFVTEYAGPSAVMRNRLASPTRFGVQSELAQQPTAAAFVQYLYQHGFTVAAPNTGFFSQPLLPATLKAVLIKYLPPPAGMQPDQFYSNFAYYQGQSTLNYQPVEMAKQIWSRLVEPTQAASALFDDLPTLTRLYTTISPEDMNRDPAFSYNRELADVPNLHTATMQVSCNSYGAEGWAMLTNPQGLRLLYPKGRFSSPEVDIRTVPASLRIEVLREEGPPVVVLDNAARSMLPATNNPAPPVSVPTRGCSAADGTQLALIGLLVAALRVRRRSFAP